MFIIMKFIAVFMCLCVYVTLFTKFVAIDSLV